MQNSCATLRVNGIVWWYVIHTRRSTAFALCYCKRISCSNSLFHVSSCHTFFVPSNELVNKSGREILESSSKLICSRPKTASILPAILPPGAPADDEFSSSQACRYLTLQYTWTLWRNPTARRTLAVDRVRCGFDHDSRFFHSMEFDIWYFYAMKPFFFLKKKSLHKNPKIFYLNTFLSK